MGGETRLFRREAGMVIIYFVSVILAVLNVFMLLNKARMTRRWPFILSLVLLVIEFSQGPISQLVGAETWHDWLTNPYTRELMRFWLGPGATAFFVIAASLTVGGLWHDGDLRRSYTYRR